jgi:hypothetical protein
LSGNGHYVGVCLDFNLAVEADTLDGLQEKMADVVASYLETVLETEDAGSIPTLLSRRAPIRDWLIYYALRLATFVRHVPNRFTFREYIPFHLAHNC